MSHKCSFHAVFMFHQGICQRKRACGEETGVPEASAAAADRERAHRILGVDLQSRLESPTKLCQSCFLCFKNTANWWKSCLSILTLQRRCCWKRKMRSQRRSPHWTARGTRGNKISQVKTGLSVCYLPLWSVITAGQ